MLKTLGILWCAAAALWAAAPRCQSVPGWQQDGKAREHTAENLFEYMDGNAEGYLIYGFAKMQGVNCKNAGGDSLILDVSEFLDEDGAYGMFTANRDPKLPVEKIGTAAQVTPRKAVFAKGKYYIEISAEPEKDHTTTLRAWVGAMEKQTEGRTTLPDALSWFSKERQKNIRLVPESVIGMRILKRGYVAEYEVGKAFVVSHATDAEAASVLEKVMGRIPGGVPAQVGDGGFVADDKYLGHVCVFRKGKYVGGWVNLPHEENPVPKAQALAAKLP